MAAHSSILARKFHGQRSPKDYSPWGHKESDTTEWSTHNLHWSTSGVEPDHMDKDEIGQKSVCWGGWNI